MGKKWRYLSWQLVYICCINTIGWSEIVQHEHSLLCCCWKLCQSCKNYATWKLCQSCKYDVNSKVHPPHQFPEWRHLCSTYLYLYILGGVISEFREWFHSFLLFETAIHTKSNPVPCNSQAFLQSGGTPENASVVLQKELHEIAQVAY